MFSQIMNFRHFTLLMTIVSAFMTSSVVAGPAMDSVQAVDSFVDRGRWELTVDGKKEGDVDFQSNHTMPDGKSIKLGRKQYRFWSVVAHPTKKGKFILRIHSEKTAGWFSFTWDESKKAWVSKHWPKHQIMQK